MAAKDSAGSVTKNSAAISRWRVPGLLEVQDRLTDLRNRGWLPGAEVDALRDLADHAARVTARLRSSLDGE